NVAAGQTLTISSINELTFDGSAETDGAFVVTGSNDDRVGHGDTLIGGAGADKLSGGLGDDVLIGGGGADIINAGRSSQPDEDESGHDVIYYNQASDSTSTHFDSVTNFETGFDQIHVPSAVTEMDTAVAHSLTAATFDADMSAISADMVAHGSVLFTAGT